LHFRCEYPAGHDLTVEFATYPSLRHAVLLISGGATGIGASIVQAAHGQGAKVAFLDIQEGQGKALAAAFPGTLFIACDVTDAGATASAVRHVRSTLGPIRVLVNNAANDDRRAPADVTPEYWDQSMSTNLKHQFFLSQQVHPHMQELGGGSIINFSSIAWRYGADAMIAYATAKSAVMGLTRALSRSYGADNIRVNTIEPGAVMTDKQKHVWYQKQEQIDAMVSRQRIQRVLEPDEIARAVMFLASEDSRMITGQTIIVDAGLS
jgi:NAD(P)-dependent dehydrogenase (short-subunit alcohol dehydrogenase family)